LLFERTLIWNLISNKNGERESLYLNPLQTPNCLLGDPLMIIASCEAEKHS
jgi:hypothetical protein